MKIAVAFFSHKNTIEKSIKKRNRKINKKENVESIYLEKNNYINSKTILLCIIIVITLFRINSNNFLFLSNNLTDEKSTLFTKEKLLSLNSILNKDCFKMKRKVEKNEEIIQSNDEYDIIDEVARNYTDIPTFSKIDESDIVLVAENATYQKLNVCGIEVVNYSSNRNLDFVSIINSDDIFFSKGKDSVLMYTTHTSESYANSSKYSFEYTSAARTTDGRYNMLSIATELGSNLKSKGISNICSINPHDYGEYNSAYMNSRLTAETILRENPDIALSIDVHRDAIEDLSFAPKTNIRELDVASMMFVMGIGYDNAPNEYYMDNLKLVFKLQLLANKVYPGLFRQIIIRNSVYNQDLNKYSFLVEVGATGNTIDEAKLSTRCLSNLINLLYKD